MLSFLQPPPSAMYLSQSNGYVFYIWRSEMACHVLLQSDAQKMLCMGWETDKFNFWVLEPPDNIFCAEFYNSDGKSSLCNSGICITYIWGHWCLQFILSCTPLYCIVTADSVATVLSQGCTYTCNYILCFCNSCIFQLLTMLLLLQYLCIIKGYINWNSASPLDISPPLPCCFKLIERTVHYRNVLCLKAIALL